ncbi:MAG: GTP-binding protein [Rhodospirillales bacterium]|nr:GTP-binding protein [Alphaproteobacteria bacterium]MCB9986277.1 GTP-binding protein [Rhodospirillales bacterium]USO07170.1 MAG: GTP-binding protein [Rhodospirillales bacterium]
MTKQIPVTVLTGYLGAGKTTLLNRILSEPHGKKYAVIINEFGSVGVDNDLVVGVDEEIFEMNNGCICCTVRGDLIRIIAGLMRRGLDKFDGIIVETTGLADPAPVAQTFFMDEDVRKVTRLDAVITVIDAKHLRARLTDSPEAQEQIAFADIIIVNKTDLVDAAELAAVEAAIRAINPYAQMHRTMNSAIALDKILDRGAFDLGRILAIEPAFLEGGHEHHHDNAVKSIALSADRAVILGRFEEWIGQILADQGQNILRSKGVLNIRNSPRRFVFQAVHMIADSAPGTAWKDGEKRASKMVFIGRDLDRAALQKGFDDCLEAAA